MNQELTTIIESSQLEPSKAQLIVSQFSDFLKRAAEWDAKCKAIIVTDESQTDLMQQAKEARGYLRDIRKDADRKRISLKESSLREGNLIQKTYNFIEEYIKGMELHLEK